jgi:hypothetical protein
MVYSKTSLKGVLLPLYGNTVQQAVCHYLFTINLGVLEKPLIFYVVCARIFMSYMVVFDFMSHATDIRRSSDH